jgi:hypothetical protein
MVVLPPLDLLMCVVRVVHVGTVCVYGQVRGPCGWVRVLWVGTYVVCMWDYVVRISGAALMFLLCNSAIVKGAWVGGAVLFWCCEVIVVVCD